MNNGDNLHVEHVFPLMFLNSPRNRSNQQKAADVSVPSLLPLLLFSSGEGLSSSNLSLLRRASVISWDPSSPELPRISSLLRRVLPSPDSSRQTSPAVYRHERHFSEPCPPGLSPSPCDSLLESSSPGAARRCSAPGGLLGEIPEVVVHPPVVEEEEEEDEEAAFRDRRGRVSCQDLSGKY